MEPEVLLPLSRERYAYPYPVQHSVVHTILPCSFKIKFNILSSHLYPFIFCDEKLLSASSLPHLCNMPH